MLLHSPNFISTAFSILILNLICKELKYFVSERFQKYAIVCKTGINRFRIINYTGTSFISQVHLLFSSDPVLAQWRNVFSLHNSNGHFKQPIYFFVKVHAARGVIINMVKIDLTIIYIHYKNIKIIKSNISNPYSFQ